jgi:serine/threonine-protein kinase
MGEVWSAHHYLLSRPAAVKLIRAEEAANEHSAERFRREAAAIARLTSPHTITLYDFGVSEQGQFYYVMELLEGEDLDVMLERSGPLSPERMAHYLVGACKSLAEAHAAGLVHRDLKPSNLFACRLGLEKDFLKVLDFGLARRAPAEESRLTQEHTVHGTPDYIAPETLTPEGSVDGRTDMYSLAATAYHLLVGQPVFSGAMMQKIIKHSTAEPQNVSERAAVPEPLAGLLMACLRKTPEERPHAHEMLEQLLASGLPQRWSA